MTPKLRLVGSPVLSRKATLKTQPFVSSEQSSSMNNNANLDHVDSALLNEITIFERHEDSTTIELFYDLFVVANLATFSNIHEINNVKTLTSYIGFSKFFGLPSASPVFMISASSLIAC